jgi:dTDP-D-glucose 4,6-dehydratase
LTPLAIKKIAIKNPVEIIHNNITSTVNLLEYARSLKTLELFFYFSTDEVFGAAPNGISFSEWDRHKPTNPYSASKSAAENICIALIIKGILSTYIPFPIDKKRLENEKIQDIIKT